MIGIVGTLILLPLALVGLAIGFVAFAIKAVAALTLAGIDRIAHTG